MLLPARACAACQAASDALCLHRPNVVPQLSVRARLADQGAAEGGRAVCACSLSEDCQLSRAMLVLGDLLLGPAVYEMLAHDIPVATFQLPCCISSPSGCAGSHHRNV